MAQINLRVDDALKTAAEQVCDELGLSMTTAITVFLKKMSREHRIPFEVSTDPFYSEENMERLRESVRRVERGEAALTEHELLEADA